MTIEKALEEHRKTVDRKPWLYIRRTGYATGKKRILIECPFCGCDKQVYVWSFAGNGKTPCDDVIQGEICEATYYYYDKHSERPKKEPG